MFTGIIEATAEVLERTSKELLLERPASFQDIAIGSSIAVSGACLTIATLTKKTIAFDVHEETWKRTKLGSLVPGDLVNLERAMSAHGRFEGHIVQGHVDCVTRVCSEGATRTGGTKADTSLLMTFEFPSSLHGLVVEKGSVTIDGVSLTIVSVDAKTFTVALIPHTLKETTLGTLKKGDVVNIEADILGKYVRSLLGS